MSDGTISMNMDPNYVLGFDGGNKVKMVKKGSENQFVFTEALDYLAKTKNNWSDKLSIKKFKWSINLS